MRDFWLLKVKKFERQKIPEISMTKSSNKTNIFEISDSKPSFLRPKKFHYNKHYKTE
jgi:hypothetical protein